MVLTRDKILIITVGVVVVLFIANTFFKETKFSGLLNTILGFAIPIVVLTGGVLYFTHVAGPVRQSSSGGADKHAQWEQELTGRFSSWKGVESAKIDESTVTISFSTPITEEMAKELAHRAAEGVAEVRRDQGDNNDFKVIFLVDKQRVHLLVYNPIKGLIKEDHF